MSFTPPPAPPPATVPIPNRRTDDDEGFDAKTDVYLVWLDALRDWLAAFIAWLVTLLQELSTAQAQVDEAAITATTAASNALAASNFRGLWPDLVGALPKHVCVKHSGRFWLSLVDLPDVTASEPGVTEDWTPTDVGVAPTAVITVSTVAVPGVCYVLAASGIKLTLAAVYAKGVYQGVRTIQGVTGCEVDFGAHLYQGRDVGLLQLDVPLVRLDLNYENPVIGMR